MPINKDLCPKCKSEQVSLITGKTRTGSRWLKRECEDCGEFNEVVKITHDPAFYRMPYGKWKNYMLKDLPAEYLVWLKTNLDFGETKGLVLLHLADRGNK